MAWEIGEPEFTILEKINDYKFLDKFNYLSYLIGKGLVICICVIIYIHILFSYILLTIPCLENNTACEF